MKPSYLTSAVMSMGLLALALSAQATAAEPRLKITDSEGRETSNIDVSALRVDLPDSKDGIFIDRKGLPLEVDNSYTICIPFTCIKYGQRGPEDVFVVHLVPSRGRDSIQGKLMPEKATLKGKFDIAGMTGDFKLTVGKIASLEWMDQPPRVPASPTKDLADVRLTLAGGTKLDVWDLQRYEIHYVSSRYINVSSYYSDSKHKDIVLVRGESEVKIPFNRIRQIVFGKEKVTATLTDGTSLDFDRISSETRDETDGLVAQSSLGSVYVEPKNIRQIEFRPAAKSKDE